MNELLNNIKGELESCTPEVVWDEKIPGMSNFLPLLKKAYGEVLPTLEISKESIKLNESYLQVDATATSLLGVYHQKLNIFFFITGNTLEVLIKAALPSTWKFSWAYPQLPGYWNDNEQNPEDQYKESFLDNFSFAGPVISLFSSVAGSTLSDPGVATEMKEKLQLPEKENKFTGVQQGLNYYTETNIAEVISFLPTALKEKMGSITPSIWAYLEEAKEDDQQIKISIDLSSWGHSFNHDFSIGVDSLSFYSSTSIFNSNPGAGVILRGSLTIGKNEKKKEVDVDMVWPFNSKSFLIRNGNPINFPSFEMMGDIFKEHKDSLSVVPEKHLIDLEIRELELEVSLDPFELSAFSLEIGAKASEVKKVATGEATNKSLFQFEDIVFKWNAHFNGLEIDSNRFEVDGLFKISGGLVIVSAVFPDCIFCGDLLPGETIELDEIFKSFAGDIQHPDIPHVQIRDLSIAADIKNNIYSIEIDITSDWSIPLSENINFVPLKDLYIAIEKDEDIRATISSVINLGGIDIHLLATNAAGGSAGGWYFEGSTGRNQRISMRSLVTQLESLFGKKQGLSDTFTDLTIENLKITFDTGSSSFLFTCQSYIYLTDSDKIELTIHINGGKGQDGFEVKFSSQLIVDTDTTGKLEFTVDLKSNDSVKWFVTTYSHKGDEAKLCPADLIQKIISNPDPSVLEIARSIKIDLKDIVFAYYSKDGKSKFLFGVDIGADLSLSNLPLIGKTFPADQSIGIENLQLYYVYGGDAEGFEASEITMLNNGLPTAVNKIPAPVNENKADETKVAQLTSGFHIAANLKMGLTLHSLKLPVGDTKSPATAEKTKDSAANASSDLVATGNQAEVKWFPLQKSIGPLHFERIGFYYKEAAIWFLLDADLSIAGLSISLDGLSVGSPIKEFKPSFNLDGLGLDYKNGPIEIGGTFLRKHYKDKDGTEYDEYEGFATIRTGELALSAIGAYMNYKNQPSFFLYAILDYPLGGPPFFFVEGLTAGMGYNRALILPSIDEIQSYPLVSRAMQLGQGEKKPVNTEEAQEIRKKFPVSIGEYFLAVGIKFNSFKMLDSFALLTVRFGQQLEFGLLGMSSLVVPAKKKGATDLVDPLINATLVLKAVYLPEKGFLGVLALLTSDSYVLSKDCHLTGGFAFYAWFKDDNSQGIKKGDFILTIGGYHPLYKPPKHYPSVPRLGFNWTYSDSLLLKGESYFAINASTLMTGMHLEASWHAGQLKAWFKAGVDFLISWQPYHYDAEMYIQLGAAYSLDAYGTQTISIEGSADLHIWGPKFSGKALVDISIISVEVSFGNAQLAEPKAISWDTFKKSFLPEKDDEVCGVSVKAGLISLEEDKDKKPLWIVDPKKFSLVTYSLIPIRQAIIEIGEKIPPVEGKEFGIGSMGIQKIGREGDTGGDNYSRHTITIQKTNSGSLPKHFLFSEIKKNVPAALWGTTLQHDLNGEKFIADVLTGLEITPYEEKEKESEVKGCSVEKGTFYIDIPIYSDYYFNPLVSKKLNATAAELTDKRIQLMDELIKEKKGDKLFADISFEEDKYIDGMLMGKPAVVTIDILKNQ